jgi:hypothetical protein
VHEFTPSELATALGERFSNVTLARQHAYVTAAILDDEKFIEAVDKPLNDVQLLKLVAGERDREIYTLAAASNAPLPQMASLAMMTTPLALNEWVDHLASFEKTVESHRRYIAEQATVVEDYHAIAARLREAEQLYDEARRAIERLEREREELIIDHLEEVQAIVNSTSWRLTKPIRSAKTRLAARRR